MLKIFFSVFMFLYIVSCGYGPDDKKQAEGPSTNLPPAVITFDSLHLSYDLRGSGDTTLLFLHGWGINKTYWDSQLAYFSPRYTVVAVDQAGFGKSDTGRTDYTVENYAADADALINQLNLKNVILIGHSMSGDIILEAAIRYPTQVAGVIGIDNFNIVGKEFTASEQKEIDSFTTAIEKNFDTVVNGYADQSLFHKSTDPATRKRVKSDFIKSNRSATLSSFKNIIVYSPKEKDRLPQLKHKLFLLNSDVNKADTVSLRQLTGASYQIFPIHATGHYPMIEKTNEFNRILQEIIYEIGKR